MKSYEEVETRALLNENLTGNVLGQVTHVFLSQAPGDAFSLSFSHSLTVVSDHSYSSFIHLFPHSFTHSLLNISWCLQHSGQWCFSFLSFLWRCMHPCTAKGPMFLSWEPETASWRTLATAEHPHFYWYPPAKTKSTCFSINKHTIEERHFSIPEKHSKALDLPRISPMGAGCSGDTAGPLAPSLCAFYTFIVFPGFPSTSLVVASQASARFSPLHATGSKAQSFVFSSLTTLTPLVISSNFVPLNTTSMPTPPTFISPHQI